MTSSARILVFGLSALVALVGCLSVVSQAAEIDTDAEYKRLFSSTGKAQEPLKTLQALNTLRNGLMSKADQDEVSKTRLEEIETLLQFRNITNCDTRIAWKLDHSLDKYDHYKQKIHSIVAYLKYFRGVLFGKCILFLDDKMNKALDSFNRKPSSLQIRRFQNFIRANTFKLPHLTFVSYIERQLLDYIGKEYGQRLNPKMKRDEFDEKFNKTLKQVCEDIKKETEFTDEFTLFFSSKTVSGQMDSQLKDLDRMRTICMDIYLHPETVAENLYKKMVPSSKPTKE